MQTYDLIGIGFGPSNIALAISLEECAEVGQRIETLFLEKQPAFAWHRDMMLDHSHMQIPFLKDLATLRNPRSRFTFINYLYEHGRLPDFINLKSFFPSRREFNDYLTWAAHQFDERCRYGEEVLDIAAETRRGIVQALRIRSRASSGAMHERLARNVVVSVGGYPSIPDCFSAAQGDRRVFHSSSYLSEIHSFRNAHRVAIIGAGQSAAEIFMDLHAHPARPKVDLIARGQAIRPSDDSPFANEVFNADFTDHVYAQPDCERAAILEEFRHTNYAAPDLELIEQLYKVLYEQKVTGVARHRYLRRHEIVAVTPGKRGIRLTLHDQNRNTASTPQYDVIILATGYRRDDYQRLLSPLASYLGDFKVDRNYQLAAPADFLPRIFLQGACESSHGLSDTLLSVTAVRAREIAHALAETPSSSLAANASITAAAQA